MSLIIISVIKDLGGIFDGWRECGIVQWSTEGYEMRIEIAKICRYETSHVIDNLIGIVRGGGGGNFTNFG